MSNLWVQLFVGGCFVALIVVLFFEKTDYLSYSVLLMVLAGGATFLFMPEIFVDEHGKHVEPLEWFVSRINWDVVFFLIAVFTIVEVLDHNKIFQDIAKRIVGRFQENKRVLFYVICIVSTLSAAIIEDLSVALVFGPIILLSCRKLGVNPAPYLLGMTITINLASTLTPFGSAENVMMANNFRVNEILLLDARWFILNIGGYFAIATTITLVLLDIFILKPSLNKKWDGACSLEHSLEMTELDSINVDKKVLVKNLVALGIFIALLIAIPQVYLVGIISMIIFVFINPVHQSKENHKRRIAISFYFRRVDYKLVYFFICLFIFVGLMEANGTIAIVSNLFETLSSIHVFWLAVVVLLVTSALSGIMDNAPVTLIFLPIMNSLILEHFPIESGGNALIIALIIGVNVGGNFLPQGSACDMATLDIAQKNCISDLKFRRLFKVGAAFALVHILIGIGYIALFIFVLH